MKQRFDAWWDGLSGREQWMVGILAVLIALAVFWYGMVEPLEGLARNAEARHLRAVTYLTEAEMLSGEIRRLDRAGTPPVEAVRAAAAKAGVTLAREQPEGQGLSVVTEPAPSSRLFAWFSALDRDHGVRVRTLELRPNEGGVEAQAILSLGQ